MSATGADFVDAALLIIDLQAAIDAPDHAADGPRNNPGAEAVVARLLAHWRGQGRPVIHIRHDSTFATSAYRPGQPGNDFKPEVAPVAGETIVAKRTNSAFIGTDLEARLRAAGIGRLVVTGVVTNNSVEATVRMAGNLGFDTHLVEDGCFTFAKRDFNGILRTADEVQAMALANLDGEYCRVISSGRLLGEPAPDPIAAETGEVDFPILDTPRLILRAVTAEDAEPFRRILSIPAVTRFTNWPPNPDAEQAAQFVRDMADSYPAGHGCGWAITDRTDGGAFIGAIRFNYFNAAWQCGGIGYEADPAYWGRGLMTEAVRAIVACGHQRFQLNHIEAWTVPGNHASDRVLEKAGFRYEGLRRERIRFAGRFHDARMFGRIAADPL